MDQRTAEYYRKRGLYIDDAHITDADDFSPNHDAPVNAPGTMWKWDNQPVPGPDGTTRYRINFGFFHNNPDDRGFIDREKDKIRLNLNKLASQTCLNFEEVFDEEKYKKNGILRFENKHGCTSHLGRTGTS